jgi:hypothetical protein
MAILQKVLHRDAAATSNVTLYTVPEDTSAIVTNIVVTNTTSGTLDATISLNGVTLIDASPVSGHDSVVFDVRQVIEAAQLVEGFASGSGLNFHISGVEVPV